MKVRPVNPFIARILDPEDDVTMFEIVAHNARMARAMAHNGAKKNCGPKGCRNKNCHHGDPKWVANQHAHADVLEQVAQELAQEIA